MSRMSLDTAIRLSAEVKGANNITKVQRSLQDLAKGSQTTSRDMQTLRAATFQYARANDGTIAGIRNSITAFRGLQEQAKIGSREFQRYGSEVQKLEGRLKGIDGTAEKAGRSMGQNLAAGLAAAGIGQALRGITMQAGKFDAEVRKAAAIGGEAGSFSVLQKEIEKVAAAAAGTPTEVAMLATSLSRAGFSAKETTEALAGIVRGAEATSVTFEEMGSIAADNLRAFGLQTNETTRVVDVLTQTANKSNQGVLDLGESMKYAAPIARNLGVPLEDLAAVMGLLANNGIRGSDAGTALRTGLTRLQIAAGGADSEIADLTRGNVQLTKAMATLGSEILDTNGKLRPLDQVLGGLRKSLSTLSATDQAILTKALFGTEAGSKFQALLNSSEGQIKQMFAEIRNSGGVAEKTQKQMQGFQYSVIVLGGNFEYLTNQIGGAIGFALKPFIDVLNAAIGVAQNLPGPIKAIGSAAAAAGITVLGLAVAIAALKAGLAALGGATAIKAAIVGVLSFGGAATTATGAVTGLKAAMLAIPGAGWAAAAIIGTGLLGKAAYDTNETFRNFVDNIGGVLAADFRSAVNGMASDARAATGDIDEAYKDLTKAMEPVADFIRQLFKDVFKDTSSSAQVSAAQSTGAFNEFFTSLSTSATAGFAGLNTIIGNWWNSLPEPIRNIFGGNAASMLAGAAQYAGGAASRATAPNAQASGMYGRYAPGGAQVPFTQPRVVPGNAMNIRVGDTVGGGGGGGGAGGGKAAAEVKKGVKELLRLTDAEITAAVNTAIGEYGGLDPRGRTDVFANILARSRSGKYPSNLVDVVTQPGQYAPNFGRSRSQVTNPNLYGRARFEQVKSELTNPQMLAQSIQDVDSRLYFKGISEQPNMVRGVDFLRARDQNFFHGPGRSDPGRNPQITSKLLGELGGSDAIVGYIDKQADAAKKLREQKQAADELLVTERNRLSILQESDPMQQNIIESMNQGLEIEKKFQDLINASPEQKKTLELAQQYAVKSNTLELERELSNLAKDAAKPLQDAVTEAGNRLAYEREYGELLSKGINPELAKQFVELDRIATTAKTNLELQIAMLEARAAELPITSEIRKELERQIELRKEQLKLIPGTVAETKGIMTDTSTASKGTPAKDITARIGVLKGEIKDLTDIGQVAITSADNIGNAFGSAFSGLISGAMSAREALAGFFKDIAAGFLEMAAQIIAKQMTMIVLQSILKALGAAAGASGGGGFGASGAGFGGSNSFGSFDAGGALAFGGGLSFAGGGYTGSAPRAGGVDGQGGFPAILHPQETVIDHTRAMAVPYQRSAATPAAAPAMEVPYQRSGPTMAVPFQKAAGGAAGGDSMNATIDVKFETVSIGGVEYVTKAEAEQIGRESALRGADLASKRYRQNPSARRRDGIG